MLSGSGRIRIMKVVGCGAVFAAFILLGKLQFFPSFYLNVFIASVSEVLGWFDAMFPTVDN